MQGNQINEFVVYAGVILGSLMLLSVIWVWMSKQHFQLGGTLLSIFGTVLIGLSVFSSVTIKIGDDLLVEFNALQEEVEELRDDNVSLSNEVTTLARSTELQRQQFIALGESLRTQNPQLRVPMEGIIDPLRRAEQPNLQILEGLRQNERPTVRENQQ